MARERRSSGDPESREDKQQQKQARRQSKQPSTRNSRNSDSDSGSEEEQQTQTKSKSTKSNRQPVPVTTKKSKHKLSTSSTPASAISASTGSASELENSDQEPESPNPRDDITLDSTDSRQSPSSRRKSASAEQQIADLKHAKRKADMARSQAVKTLEKENNDLKRDLEAAEAEKEAAEKEKDEAKQKLEAMRQAKKDLRDKYRDILAKQGGRKSTEPKNSGMILQIKKTTKKKLWRFCKFIVNDKQLQTAANHVLKELKIATLTHKEGKTTERTDKVDDGIEEWLSMYATDVRAAINDQRSYVQSEMKKIALAWLKQGESLLPFDDFKAIALRNVDGDDENPDPEKEKHFDLYLTFLSAVAGSGIFGDKARRTDPVSLCMTAEGKTAVPPSTEAMCLIMYDNCRQKWLNMHQYKELDKLAGDIPKYSSKRHDETKQWMGKYSDSCSGNSPYGGWSTKGIKAFNALTKDIRMLRDENLDDILPVEKFAAARFLKVYNDERKRKKAANRKEGEAEEENEDDLESESQKRAKNGDDNDDDLVVEMDMDA